ncbi:MAG: hypothetical protein KJ066_02275 [Acidobacteria bacterium]|nr:hypothetical protein [Acidobacteriota bacterium]
MTTARSAHVGPLGIAVALLIVVAPARAQDVPVAVRASVEWITAVRGVAPAHAPLNPTAVILGVPQLGVVNEWRPNVRVEVGPRLQIVARPRLRVTSDTVWQGGREGVTANDVTANWTELYADWKPSDWLGVGYGLQNYQWGPAELVGPSNRLFHEVALFRDALYYVKGRHLARVNLSFGRQWSIVSLAEVGAVSDVEFTAGEPFARSGQVKAEFATASGSGYVGVTVGGRDGARPWVGEYFSMELAGGWSVYADVVHRRGSRAWYPREASQERTVFVRDEVDASGVRTFGVAGVRYAFVAGTDARVEFVHQEAGWSRRQIDLAALAAASRAPGDAAGPYALPGIEFLGRRLLLGSVRLPDVGPGKRVDLQARHLRSITDDSSVTFVNATVDATDALVVFVSASTTAGNATAEFSRFVRGALVVGAVHTW